MLPERRFIFAAGFSFLVFTLLVMRPEVTASPEGFIPITPDNVARLQILSTLPGYKDASDFCACDARFFSQNGRTLATDWKIQDLTTGMTLSFAGRGYPLALSPDGRTALVSGQKNGTRLVDVETGTERLLTSDDAEDATFSPDGSLVAFSSLDADAAEVWNVADASLATNLGRSLFYAAIGMLNFTPDGQYLLWVDREMSLQRWKVGELGSSVEIASHLFHYKFAPDSGTAIINVDFETVEVWDVFAGKLLGRVTYRNNQAGVDVMALSPDRHTLAIGYFGGNSRLVLWDISGATPQKIREYDHESRVMIFTPDSRFLLLAAGGGDRSCSREGEGCSYGTGDGRGDGIQVVDAQTGAEVATFGQDAGELYDAALNPDGNLLVTFSIAPDGIQFWRLDGGNATRGAAIVAHDFALSPDWSTLLVEVDRSFLAVYGIASESRPVRTFLWPGHIKPSSVNVRAEPDGGAAIVGTASGDVRVLGRSVDGTYVYVPDSGGWIRADSLYFQLSLNIPTESLRMLDDAQIAAFFNPQTPTPVASLTAAPSVALAPQSNLDGMRLSVGQPVSQPIAPHQGLIPITPENAAEVALLAVLPQAHAGPHPYFPTAISAVSADGTRLITAPTEQNAMAQVWNLLTFQAQAGPETGDNKNSTLMAASPDGDLLAYSLDDYRDPLQLWSAETGTNIAIPRIPAYSGAVGISLAFSPDGRTLAYQGGLLDIPSRQIRAAMEDTGGLVFSPDSRLLAVIGAERVYIYDVQTGKAVTRTPRFGTGQNIEPEMALFSPDGSRLLTVSYSQINVFDSQTGELVYNLPAVYGQPGWVMTQATFSSDGQMLVTLSPDGILTTWNACTGEPISAYDTGGARGMAFSPDGRLLAIGDPLRLVDLTTGMVVNIDGNWGGGYIAFSPDGSTLLVDSAEDQYSDRQSVMVFGIPTTERPAWTPLTGRIVPSAVNMRAEAGAEAQVIGSASGDVQIGGRDVSGMAVYLQDAGGWVWAAPEYLDLGESSLDALPVRVSSG